MTKPTVAPLNTVFFYSLERAIKAYRQFAQARIDEAGIDITVDQWLVLRTIQESPDVTQQQLGTAVFKDFASITRIIHLLVDKGYLHRAPHPTDGRRSALSLTIVGTSLLRKTEPVVRRNRQHALRGIRPDDVQRAREMLDAISDNCQPRDSR